MLELSTNYCSINPVIIIINLKNLKASFGVADELLDVVVLLQHVRTELLVLVIQPFHLLKMALEHTF